MSGTFRLVTEFKPRGDQPAAIEALMRGFGDPTARQVLLGVTGSGKTFTMAHLIERLQTPTLVVAPNKTLASQLFSEFRELFPEAAVEYFVSYFDYYQPEAYLPSSDTYIEKDARRNERIDRMRNAATAALSSRRDVIVVASVSCIYGLGSPETYNRLALSLARGARIERSKLVRGLVRTQHTRAEVDFRPGSFRLRGPAVEIWPIHENDRLLRIELDDDRIDEILLCDPLTGEIYDELERTSIYPVGHYVQPEEQLERAQETIRAELNERLKELHAAGKLLEAERLERRTLSDLEDMEEIGFCTGIENYSRHLEGRARGQAPFTLLHYFPRDFLTILDESHVSLPQLYGMVRGDLARKRTLVDYGFRLPSALDNRPLHDHELEGLIGRVLYVSATPAETELKLAERRIVEQIVRPTGLIDPPVEIRPAMRQVEDALRESKLAVENGQRVLITTLTKRSAEDLSEFFQESRMRARYLHADIDTIERSELLRDLRLGVFDILIGINLLREGLDLPEVGRVLILDADQEGFLRSTTSLIQTFGRAARNAEGRVILYADKRTGAMEASMAESDRRREIQSAYNEQHGIVPQTIRKRVGDALSAILNRDLGEEAEPESELDPQSLEKRIQELHQNMLKAAAELDFEHAVRLRDEMRRLEAVQLELRTEAS